MPLNNSNGALVTNAPRRLDGWKEIADYLRKGLRTAQRWERDSALPVHRLPGKKRDAVFAIPSEIDAWMATHSHLLNQNGAVGFNDSEKEGQFEEAELAMVEASERPMSDVRWQSTKRIPRRYWILALTLVAIAGMTSTLRATRRPASWEVKQNTLYLTDANQEPLWQHTFDFPLSSSPYEPAEIQKRPSPPVYIADLEGDGSVEVVFLAVGLSGTDNALFCFESDGKVRFVRRTQDVANDVRFGGEAARPALTPVFVFLTADPGNKKSLWLVSIHNLWFPSVVHKLSPTGKLAGEYWSNGHIQTLRDGVLGNRRLVLIGSTNNEFKAAALAVLDYDNPWGRAPSVSARYTCEGCPAQFPLTFLIFPEIECARAFEARPTVGELKSSGDGNIVVGVWQYYGQLSSDMPWVTAPAFYKMGPSFELIDAELGDAYRFVHKRLELQKMIKHPFDSKEAKELFPVLSWNGKRFDQLDSAKAPKR